jgi:hypothetical protein
MPRAKKSKKSPYALDLSRLDECSTTELVQIARRIGYEHVSPQMERSDLIDLIWGDDIPVDDPLSRQRQWLLDYIQGNAVMLSGLTCSMECLSCPHDRVVACYAANFDLVGPAEEKPPFR